VRICIIGKFPPIQGGVSMRTYWTAHALGARGHDVHVVTNAKEATPPFRMHMRDEDWHRCDARSEQGAVTVHWSDPVDRSQNYIPMASPYVTKLATLAARIHSERPLDVIYSHYMEPYGVAGYLVAAMTGAPHVVRMAGSDAGRLWHHPQFETLYDHVLRSAEAVVAVGPVAERAVQRGVDPGRIASGGGYRFAEDLFAPTGPVMDVAAVRNEVRQAGQLTDLLWGDFAGGMPHFGIYGKLGDNKGSFALLEAMSQLKREGLNVGLVALAHGRDELEARFRDRARLLGLADRVLQIPYLPHWRVPEFLRSCLAVCCLEQNFPIGFHSPIIPLEVLLCGSCLVASTEVIRKLAQWRQLPHGYGCVAIKDVNNIPELAGRLASIARQPELATIVGARGRAYAQECQRDVQFPEPLESILIDAAKRGGGSVNRRNVGPPPKASPFALTQMACAALSDLSSSGVASAAVNGSAYGAFDLDQAEQVRISLQERIAHGDNTLKVFAQAVEVELAIAKAATELKRQTPADGTADPLFRVDIDQWALPDQALKALVPIPRKGVRLLEFDFDISDLQHVTSAGDFPSSLGKGPSHIVVFETGGSQESLMIDRFTARILQLSDGSKTAGQIADQLQHQDECSAAIDHLAWIENLVVAGFIGLRETRES
jgi:glycosyltransferase involved in cell wall biosynthesis